MKNSLVLLKLHHHHQSLKLVSSTFRIPFLASGCVNGGDESCWHCEDEEVKLQATHFSICDSSVRWTIYATVFQTNDMQCIVQEPAAGHSVTCQIDLPAELSALQRNPSSGSETEAFIV